MAKRHRFPNHTPLAVKLATFSKPDSSGCILWTSTVNADGYGTVGKNLRAHRVAWQIANGREIPVGMVVCHSCDVPNCVNPNHLWLGTQAQNVADRDAKNRRPPPCGVLNGNATLTPNLVRAIRAMPGKHRDIAKQFQISKSQVTGIKNRQRWAHIN